VDYDDVKQNGTDLAAQVEMLSRGLVAANQMIKQLQNEVFGRDIPATCAELYDRGESQDGSYQIQPSIDGNPFFVYCKFSNGIGTTIIQHDKQENIQTSTLNKNDGCDEPGCHNTTLQYAASTEQMVQLMELSDVCEQSIIINCSMTSLTPTSWWLDRSFTKRQYWHGSFNNEQGCACYLESKSCISDIAGREGKCNCDSFRVTSDSGLWNNSDHLPVKSLHFGGSGGSYRFFAFNVGNLECTGKSKKAVYPSEMHLVDYYFKYYSINSGQINENTNIIFTLKDVDNTRGAYDASTGKFTAPVDGRYEFSINILVYTSGNYYMKFQIFMMVDSERRDQIQYWAENTDKTTYRTHAQSQMTTEVELTKGQSAWFFMDDIYSVSYVYSHAYHESCKLHGTTTGCSFIQGKIIKRF